MKKAKVPMKIAIACFLVLGFFLFFLMGNPSVFAADVWSEEAQAVEIAALMSEVNYLESATKSEDITAMMSAPAEAQEKQALKTLTLKDFDHKHKYLYVEFDQGGYAVYDREGSYIYERTGTGAGPYANYSKSGKLYYGGPTNYFIKESNTFKNTVTGDVITKEQGQKLTLSHKDVRVKAKQEKAQLAAMTAEAQNSGRATASAPKCHFLGEKMTDSETKSNVNFYFTMLTLAADAEYDKGNSTPVIDLKELGGIDVAFAKNRFGSCSFVAAGMVMQFYDRLKIRDMVPDDISKFEIMYPANANRGERLHQELIFNAFPSLQGSTTLDGSSFGCNFLDLKPAISSYFNKYGTYTDTTRRVGNFGMEAQVRKGNPVLVSFAGGYHLADGDTKTVGQHAVPMYGYTTTSIFPEIANELIVNFGWYQKGYGQVFFKSSLVNENINFDVY